MYWMMREINIKSGRKITGFNTAAEFREKIMDE